MIMTDSEFAARYPEGKPVCFNYAAARADVLALRGENLRLEKRLAVFEDVFNPDMAKRFFAMSEDILEKLYELLARPC